METDLSGAIKNDDLNAFNDAYNRYHSRLYSFILFKTQCDFTAKEVVQLSFIRLWEKRSALDESLDLDIQLFGMAKQIMLAELRKEARRLRHNEQANPSPLAESLIKAVENRDLLKHFEKEIENLPKMRKLVYDLSRRQGFSHQEIAELLSISPKTVENHIGKVLSALKQYMLLFFL